MLKHLTTLTIIGLALLFAGCGDEVETESVCMQLDTSVQRHVIRDYQYARYRFFDLGMIGGVSYLGVGDSILEFRLYQSVGSLDPQFPEAVAYPNAFEPTSSPDSVQQKFRQVEIYSEYDLILGVNEGRYFIWFPEPLQNVQTTTLAYYMVVRKSNRSLLTFGSFSESKFRLQMLKRSQSLPSDPLWNAEWKNVYDLGIRNIDYEYFALDIFKGFPGDEENPTNLNYQGANEYYLRVLGLDRVGATGNPPPDGKIDDNAATFDTARGLLVFPDRFPFASDVLEDPTSSLYTLANALDLQDSSKYYLRLRYEEFDLGRRDIVEGSVRITVNGVSLTQGFSVAETKGKLWLTNDSAYVSDASVEICFEYWK